MAQRKKTSIIWSISSENLQILLNENDSLGAVLEKLGFTKSGGNAKNLNQRIKQDNLDLSYIKSQKIQTRVSRNKQRQIPLKNILTTNSSFHRTHLKERLLKENLLKNECYNCGIKSIWDGKPLSLQLDHINGVGNDNTLDNLRLLCPNCHSQTDTYSGKNMKIVNKNIQTFVKCKICNIELKSKSIHQLCNKCFNFTNRKAERPSLEVLLKEIEETNYCAVGRKYGVSDNAIRNWIKNYH